MRPTFAAVILLGVAAPACRAQAGPDLRVLTPDEMSALAAECPESNHIIPAGTAVAYGELFEAPLLITKDKDRILIDGVQVVPRAPVDPNSQALKIAGRLHSQFYLAENRKDSNASRLIEKKLDELKTDRTIDDYQVWKRRGKLAAILVKAGGGQARVYLDSLPLPLIQKYQFIISALLSEYLLKEESGGRELARPWLRARLEDLKTAGKIEELQWEPEKDIAKIRFPGETSPRDYGFGEDRTPFGIAYAKRWQARRKETEAAAQLIADRLKAGGLLIYSASFEKARPADPAAVRAFEAVSAGRDVQANLGIVSERLRLTRDQARSLGEEYQ